MCLVTFLVLSKSGVNAYIYEYRIRIGKNVLGSYEYKLIVQVVM